MGRLGTAPGALLLALLVLAGSHSFLVEADEDSGSTSSSGRGLLQAPRTQQPQVHQPQQQQAGAPTDRRLKLDTRIEDAILQTHAPADQKQPGAQQRLEEAQRRAALAAAGSRPTPARKPTVGGVQMQPKQQQQKQRVAQQAAQAALLEQQQRQAQEQAQRANAAREEQRAQQTLGRGSLRARTGVAKQPAVTGSRKDDVFARHMEWQLAKARERLLQQQQMQQQAVKAPGGGGAARAPIARAPIAPGVVTAPVPQQQQQQQQPQKQHTSLLLIVAMTLAMAAAGGIGALPFFFVRSMSAGATGVATAVACGVMLAASFDLVHDGEPYGPALTVAGVLLGGWFIRWVQQHLAQFEDIAFGALQGSAARKTLLMVGIMAAHALGEGCAVGVSFCGDRGWAQGLLTTLAIGVHNVPEGLAKATVLVGQGVSPRRALLWSIATCLPQPLVAVPSFIFVEAFTVILPVALGFAAGCMVWMVLAELLPDALERADARLVATAATAAAAGLEGFRMLFASMEQPDGSFAPPAAAASAGSLLARAAPPLMVLLPAVAGSAAAAGGLGSSTLPSPVAWGMLAASVSISGGGSVLDQLLLRPRVPALHTIAAAAAGAALVLFLHKQLMAWAGSAAAAMAAKLLERAGEGPQPAGRSVADVEALEYASLYQQHHLHHHVSWKHHPHTHILPASQPTHLEPFQQRLERQHAKQQNGGMNGMTAEAEPAGPEEITLASGGLGGMNDYSSSSSLHALQAPYHRGSTTALPGSSTPLPSGAVTPSAGLNGGSSTPVRRWRASGMLLPAPQLAAAATVVAALAASSVATGWHLACSLLLLGEDRSAALLPALALLAAGPGLAGGALARTLPTLRGTVAGAWAGGGLAALAALVAAVTAARARDTAHVAALVRTHLYPMGITDTAEAMAGGALCATAVFCFSAGAALKPRSTRGGVLLGAAAALLLAGLRYALCSSTPYCLSVSVLLQGR